MLLAQANPRSTTGLCLYGLCLLLCILPGSLSAAPLRPNRITTRNTVRAGEIELR